MKIVTMTLSGAGQAHLLAEAIGSAAFADEHLVIDTSPDRSDVRNALQRVERPIVVRAWPWREDFAAARNVYLAEAAALVDGITWGVVLDSDERLVFTNVDEVRAEFASFGHNTASAQDTTGHYTKERAFRLPSSAKYVGPTHEACIDTGEQDRFRLLTFWELTKTPEQFQHKLRRDVGILRKHTKKNPCDARWWYYLGDTLESLGNKLEAVEAFMSCAKLRGWDEESAWACYRAANILLEKERYTEAIETSARGLARHPGIAELAWVAAVASFRSGQKEKAAYWAKMSIAMGDHAGVRIGHTRSGFRHMPALYELPYDVLRFAVSTPEERERAEEEFWKAKFHRYGADAETIAILRRSHDGVQWEARNDIGRRAKTLSQLAESTRIYPITNPSSTYHCMNPSVCVYRGRLVSTIRTVNYVIDDQGRYIMPPHDEDVVKTENYLADVSPDDYSLSNVRHIRSATGAKTFPTKVIGYEDLRLAPVGDRLFASATVRDHSPHMPCDITVCEITEDGSIIRDCVQPAQRDEKNWMPFVRDGVLSFLYSVDPTVVRRFDLETGLSQEVSRATPHRALEHLRGGSQVIAIPDAGWLVVTHEVVILDDRRRYLHRFVRLDNEFHVTHLSHAWRLRPHLGIEFVAGMALHNGTIVLSAGLDDREACFVTIALEDVMRLASQITDHDDAATH
jgi:tetratricopeptide (TPR) repeat protein